MADHDLNRREVIRATTVVLSAALLGCDREPGKAQQSPELWVANRQKVEFALAALLERPRNENAYVIFEEKESGKFVQFAHPAHKGLILDLPSQTLDDAETARATDYFGELGIKAIDEPVFDGPDRKVVGRQRTFQMMFGRDIRAAASVASEVFRRVYQFPPDFEMIVTEI